MRLPLARAGLPATSRLSVLPGFLRKELVFASDVVCALLPKQMNTRKR